MFGFGNKKRIEELERQIEVLARNGNNFIFNEVFDRMNVAFKDYLVSDVQPCKCPIDEETAEKCFNCRIKTGVRIKGTKAVGGETITTHYIPAKEAIEKIMDHLCLEFDHIDAKPSDTVIKPKETP